MDPTATEQATKLFEGRAEAIGTETGGCLRMIDDKASIGGWDHWLLTHFNGDSDPIGVYPMIPHLTLEGNDWTVNWIVHWGCIDYDEGDEESLVHARNTIKVLDLAAGIVGWIEKSRSKGYHVWVFADQAVPALTMRKALLAAAQVVNAPMKEINPKQVELGHDPEHNTFKLGNYVRLPYPSGILSEGRHRNVMDADGSWLTFEQFIKAAWDNRCTIKQLETMGNKYVAPAKRQRHAPANPVDADKPWRERLDGYTYTLLYGHGDQPGGPYEGQDRSSWLWKLCNALIERTSLTEDEILEALLLGHDTYTPDKFAHPEQEMERMIGKAMEAHE